MVVPFKDGRSGQFGIDDLLHDRTGRLRIPYRPVVRNRREVVGQAGKGVVWAVTKAGDDHGQWESVGTDDGVLHHLLGVLVVFLVWVHRRRRGYRGGARHDGEFRAADV